MLRTFPAALVLFVWAVPSVASAQPWQDFHFQADADRHVIVDDRGGQGTGYSFNMGYDPDDYNGENFCSHCSLAVFVSDPGIDFTVLELLGIERATIQSTVDLVSELERIVATPPETLAMQLMPELTPEDLVAFADEIRLHVTDIADVLTRLNTLESVQDGSLDWATADLQTLIDTLGLELDSAYRADFANPNDPRGHNSDVEVYTLGDFVTALVAQGAPMSTVDGVESLLSSIPSLPGAVEISGDDDSPLSPVSFHGVHTDLTVNMRSYVVSGNDAFLLTFTVVNDTSRLLPLVEVALIADFDIPPSSYDTETSFEPTTSTVMVYDSLPLEDPEIHNWFGVAPAGISAPAAGSFVFANYNLDNMLSLSQTAASINLNRFRFFMWNPDLTGDHDDATGKSEKQGAISLVLPGPMLPGDQRDFAFCMTGAESTASGAAQAQMLATMAACQAMYTSLIPNCGDGQIQFGEECDTDPVSGNSCTDECEIQVCGDGRINGDEVCDDGNIVAGDGCSDVCRVEECGNGFVDVGEDCDDGNLSNADACLNSCDDASCGDGFVQLVGDGMGCAGREYCLQGTFRIDQRFVADTGVFNPLMGIPVDFTFAFDVVDTSPAAGIPNLTVFRTGPVRVEMMGNSVSEGTLAPALDGATWEFAIENNRITRFTSQPLAGGEFSFEIRSDGGVMVDVDGAGIPILTTLELQPATFRQITVRRMVAGATTDESIGRFVIPARIDPGTPGASVEQCDDGNSSDFDSCTSACVPSTCGDGFLQVGDGEECDEGLSPPVWCQDCRRMDLAACGNGSVEMNLGEACDDGNRTAGDGCSDLCIAEFCGDGIVQAGEQCDDGTNGDGDGCTDACVIEFCGDGVTQPDEDCDMGAANADTADCLSSCELGVCGDGFVLAGTEECDDGNTDPGDGCNDVCILEVCGDGMFGPDEGCDDGNLVDADGCSADCVIEFCGDRRPGPEEQCDDGNAVDGDGCNKDCSLEAPEACGDGNVGIGEQCDDGGTADGDGCTQFCQLENPESCGDGTVDPGEGCDDGNAIDGDGCGARCTVEACGDGIHQTGESCDDGNPFTGDGCGNDCQTEPSLCGNGLHEYGEQCDDANRDDSDACTNDCAVNPPGSAPLRDTCGNGALDLGEQCDDGGREDGNGCDGTCQREATVCGNARLEHGETCDDGNPDNGDGCSDECLIEGVPMPEGCSGCAVPGRSNRPGWLLASVLGLVVLYRRRRRRQGR